MKHLTVPAGLSQLLIDFIQDNNLTVTASVAHTLQEARTQKRMPMVLWWSLLEQVKEIHPMPALGVYIGRCIKPSHISVLGYLAHASPDFYSFCRCFQHFQPILQNSAAFSMGVDGDLIYLSWKAVVERQPDIANEVLVSSVISLVKNILGQPDVVPLRIEFPAPTPTQPELYAQLFGCPILFNADAVKIWVPMDLMHLPISSSDPNLKFLLDQQAEALLMALPKSIPFLTQLQLAIVDSLKDGEPSAEIIALKLKYSLRTLYRKLAEHGFKYSELLSNTRFELARTYLADHSLSLLEVSLLLGYSEQSAFSRAFRIWSGYTPSVYRKMRL